MARYDGGWRSEFDRGYGRWRGPGGGGPPGPGGSGRPFRDPWERGDYARQMRGPVWSDRGAYDRDLYGGGYPGFREYPGGGGVGRGSVGYDAPFADRPFLPEDAYRRHPEYERPPRHGGGHWPDGPGGAGYDVEPDDQELRQWVRESLYGDTWVDADRIEVEVAGGVVTLTGRVGDYMEARYAGDDAWETPGVRGVVNQLTVATEAEPEEES